MKISRRTAITAITAAAAGVAVGIWPRPGPQRVRHILPSVTAESLSLSVSLEKPAAELLLAVSGQPHRGHQTDTEGRFWSFTVTGLSPATEYSLRLLDGDTVLQDVWPLKTFPDWDDMPSRLRLMAYTCAGGGDGFGFGDRQFFKPHAFRQKLFDEGLAQQPDAVIAIGDQIYYDLKGQEVPSAGKGLIKQVSGWYMRLKYGAFDRSKAIFGNSNETVLKKIGDEQIARLYGTRFKSVPVFFVADDHDYFENDDATEQIVTFPPDAFSRKAYEAVAALYYPPLPHAPSTEVNRHFGILRYGRLFEAPLFDCAGNLSFSADQGHLVPAEVEDWLKQRIATSDARHFALMPSHPMGWTAGKWREWYPDVVAPVGFTGVVSNELMADMDGVLTVEASKYLWPKGWWEQHQRLLEALYRRSGSRFTFSGDIHAQGATEIRSSGELSLQNRPVTSVLVGPVSSSDATWPSSARGISAAEPRWLDTHTLSATREVNGFAMLEIDQGGVKVRLHDCGGNDRSKGEDGRVLNVSELSINP